MSEWTGGSNRGLPMGERPPADSAVGVHPGPRARVFRVDDSGATCPPSSFDDHSKVSLGFPRTISVNW